MYAYVVEEANGPFLRVDLPRPTVNENGVLIRIQASGVNPLDTKIRAGVAAHAKQPLPAVLGLDVAGTVEEVGSGVTRFKPGDKVYGMVGGVGGLQGTLAELIEVDANLIAHKPQSLSMREAAALPLATITAWEGLVDRAKVHAGQSVLVHAGAGGVGNVVIQLARAFGAEVFSTVSSDKSGIVKDLGATAIDYACNCSAVQSRAPLQQHNRLPLCRPTPAPLSTSTGPVRRMNCYQQPRLLPVLWHACRSLVSTHQDRSATDLSSYSTTPQCGDPQPSSGIKPPDRAHYSDFIHSPNTSSPIQST